MFCLFQLKLYKLKDIVLCRYCNIRDVLSHQNVILRGCWMMLDYSGCNSCGYTPFFNNDILQFVVIFSFPTNILEHWTQCFCEHISSSSVCWCKISTRGREAGSSLRDLLCAFMALPLFHFICKFLKITPTGILKKAQLSQSCGCNNLTAVIQRCVGLQWSTHVEVNRFITICSFFKKSRFSTWIKGELLWGRAQQQWSAWGIRPLLFLCSLDLQPTADTMVLDDIDSQTSKDQGHWFVNWKRTTSGSRIDRSLPSVAQNKTDVLLH